MPQSLYDRRTALARAAALGIGLGASTRYSALAAQTPSSSPPPGIRGIGYDTGWGSVGDLSRTIWREAWMQGEMAAIANDLHCSHVLIFGTEIARMKVTAETAIAHGLTPWLQPRLMDGSWAETTTQMAQAATVAESLRQDGTDVVLSLGAELPLFTLDVVPGGTFGERMETMYANIDTIGDYAFRVNEFHAQAIPDVRKIFGGQITYAAAAWEAPQIDWDRFDIIGLNAYRDQDNVSTFREDLRSFKAIGKPIVITEFGCCTYKGAEELGGNGYDIIDWNVSPPEVLPGHVYDQQVQADYIRELLGIFAEEGMDGTFIYEFIQESPYSDEERYNFDMVNFGVVRTIDDGSDASYSISGTWEPKVAFDVIADAYSPD